MDVSWAFRLLQLQDYTLNFTEMILYFNLTKLRLMNFYQVMTNVQLFLSQEDLETLKLKDAAKVFDEKYKAFDAAVQPMRGDVDTKELNKLDERRDKALIGLYGHVRVFTGFPEEANVIAGGWDGSLSTDGSITVELQAITGATSELGYTKLGAYTL